MNVYLQPTGLYSRAMLRIAAALTCFAPPNVAIVPRAEDADLRILYVIGYDALDAARAMTAAGQRYAALQCCLASTTYTSPRDWAEFWRNSALVWSYYDLRDYAQAYGFNFYRSPLGLDNAFSSFVHRFRRERRVITSGYVTGPHAEAIEEVWVAAARAGIKVTHLGPNEVVSPNTKIRAPHSIHECTDETLAQTYGTSLWVSALRHTEGFEMPGIEGLACGARPIVFDLPCYRQWYGPHAIYVPDTSGESLVSALSTIFSYTPRPLDAQEHHQVLETFNWQTITTGFWNRLLEGTAN